MSTTTTNFGWTVPSDTDLVKDGAAAIRTALGGVDTSFVDLKGGTTGQVLSKASGTDLDFTWVAQDDSNAIQNTIVDAKGDLIVATAADTPARLAVGTNGYVLTADSGEATGMKWAAAAGGGKVLQVVAGYSSTATSNSTTTYADTTLTASITPSSSSSKVLVLVSQNGVFRSQTNQYQGCSLKLLRNSTDINTFMIDYGYTETTLRQNGSASVAHLDSPATTSSVTYKTQFKTAQNEAYVAVQFGSSNSSIILLEIGA